MGNFTIIWNHFVSRFSWRLPLLIDRSSCISMKAVEKNAGWAAVELLLKSILEMWLLVLFSLFIAAFQNDSCLSPASPSNYFILLKNLSIMDAFVALVTKLLACTKNKFVFLTSFLLHFSNCFGQRVQSINMWNECYLKCLRSNFSRFIWVAEVSYRCLKKRNSIFLITEQNLTPHWRWTRKHCWIALCI